MHKPATEPSDAQASSEGWLQTWLILGGLVLGAIVGQVIFSVSGGDAPAWALELLRFAGEVVFIGLLKMMVVPLVVCSVIVGAASIGEPSQLGRVGGATIGLYLLTMAVAVVVGLVLVTAVDPGDPHRDGTGIGAEVIRKGEAAYAGHSNRAHIEATGREGLGGALRNIVQQMIPSNPVAAAAEGQILPLITMSILLGIALTMLGPRGKPLLGVIESLYHAIMVIVGWVIWLAPVGVFALVAWTVARLGGQQLIGPLVAYMATVLGALTLHAVLVLPLLIWMLGGVNPYRFLHQCRKPIMTALGTASSSATLPVSIETAVAEGGCSQKAAGFVLPLGATINMDGTALYEAVAVVFLFQCYGIHLGPAELAIVAITATLAAIGAAGIPSAGLVTMVIVVEAVNNSLGGAKTLPIAAVGLILGVDRVLDMCRTAVNVWGDLAVARIITRLLPDPPGPGE